MTTSQKKNQSKTQGKGRQSVSGGSDADRYRGVVERGVSDQAAIESHFDFAEAMRAVDFVTDGRDPETDPWLQTDNDEPRFSYVLERAKRLSVTPEFHEALEKFRQRWQIEVAAPPPAHLARADTPDGVLMQYCQ
jgi:hypothetical protein